MITILVMMPMGVLVLAFYKIKITSDHFEDLVRTQLRQLVCPSTGQLP